jgi:hypothetical protein
LLGFDGALVKSWSWAGICHKFSVPLDFCGNHVVSEVGFVRQILAFFALGLIASAGLVTATAVVVSGGFSRVLSTTR